jgi:hypothetical protein
MSRGRKPIPLKILQMTGSSALRKAKNRGKVEIEPPVGRPPAPPLPQYAADVYRSILTDLELTPGLLTRLDGGQLERYARFTVRWRLVESEYETMIAASGSVWKVLARDELRAALRGLLAESRKLDQALKEIENNFGMTPAARRSLAVAAKPQLTQRSFKPA